MKTTFRNLLVAVIVILYSFTSQAQPVVTGLSAVSGAVGSTVTIYGSGSSSVTGENSVRFGGAKAVVSASMGNSLQVVVPTGFTDKPVSVTVNNLTAYASHSFNVTFPGGGSFTTGSFAPKQDLPGTSMMNGIASGDLDGDNKPEIITINVGGAFVSVYKNNSTGNNLNFASRIDFPTASNLLSVAINDLDGDGKNDIVVGTGASYTVSVLRNTSASGSISLAEKVDFPVPYDCYAITVGELNGDGKPDIIAANSIQGISVLKNASTDGTISFENYVNYVAGPAATDIAVQDLNADGMAELITCNNVSNQVCILKNQSTNGNMAFAAPVFFATDGGPLALAVGDLYNDGKPDIATSNGIKTISILKNTGNGNTLSFDAGMHYPIGHGNSRDIVIGDINGDGRPDIACANNDVSNSVTVFRNTSEGSLAFTEKQDYMVSGSPSQLAISDLTGDGRYDLLTIHKNATISIFRNKMGQPPSISSFTPVSGGLGAPITIHGSNLSNVTSVHFGNVPASSFSMLSDAKISAVVGAGSSGDISVASSSGTAALAGFVFEHMPTISSFHPTTGPIGQRVKITGTNFSPDPAKNHVYFGAAKAEVNRASATELVVTVPTGATYEPISVSTANHTAWSERPFGVSFRNGSLTEATFKKQVEIFDDHYDAFTTVAIADIDGDGRTDVLVNSFPLNCFWVYRNTTENGALSFAPRMKITTQGRHPYHLAIGDLDADGKQDVILANDWSHNINLFRNTSTPGKISFALPISYNVGLYPHQVVLSDLDSDGKPDLVIANESSTFISLFRNTSGPASISFSAHQTFNTKATHNSSVHATDVDGDGKKDIVAGSGGDSSFSIFRNTSIPGTISLAPRVDVQTGSTTSFITSADLDEDGKADLLVSKGNFNSVGGNKNIISVYRNTSSPGLLSFDTNIDLTANVPANIVLNDLDGDGKADLVSSDKDSYVYFLQNKSEKGKILFHPPVHFLIGTSSNPRSVAVGDLDGDGKPDIASANDNFRTMSVLVNQNPSDVEVCSKGSLRLYSNLLGTIYQWQVDSGQGFVNILPDSLFPVVDTVFLNLDQIPSSWNEYKFRCVVDGKNSKVSILKLSNHWTGAVDNTWENPANWSCGKVPDAQTAVLINSGSVVVSSHVTIKSLRIDPDAEITVGAGYTITLKE